MAGGGVQGERCAWSPALKSLGLASWLVTWSPAAHHGWAAWSAVGDRLLSAPGSWLVGTRGLGLPHTPTVACCAAPATRSNGQEHVSGIVSFAGTGGLTSSRVHLYFFVFGEGNQNLFVVQASLWLCLRLLPCVLEGGSQGKEWVKVCFQEQGHNVGWKVAEKRLDLGHGGWHAYAPRGGHPGLVWAGREEP